MSSETPLHLEMQICVTQITFIDTSIKLVNGLVRLLLETKVKNGTFFPQTKISSARRKQWSAYLARRIMASHTCLTVTKENKNATVTDNWLHSNRQWRHSPWMTLTCGSFFWMTRKRKVNNSTHRDTCDSVKDWLMRPQQSQPFFSLNNFVYGGLFTETITR